MRVQRKQLFWAGMLLSILGMLHGSSAAAQAAAPKGVLKQAIHWGLSADWLDPASGGHGTSAWITLYLLHDALLKPMPEGTYAPSLAESWTVSPDAKVYEFKLRPGVKFHNGDPFTAEDVVFSFRRYKAAQAKFIHEKTEKVEAVNPLLVRISFKEPFPDFLDYFLPGSTTIAWVAPKKYIEKVGEAAYKKQPVGLGPYKLVEFVPGVRLVAEANENYWRKVPHVKRLEFHIVMEPATRVAMVRRGEVDIATFLSSVYYEDVKKDPKLRLLNPLSSARFTLYMASQWDPKSPWSDPRVRKAASLAIDRKTVADVQSPGAEPVGALGLQGDPLALQFPPDPYDPAGARKLLAEAGYPKGFQGGKFYPYQGGYWPYGEMVANYLKAVGIHLDTVLLDRPAWYAMREGGKMKGSLFIDPASGATIGGRLLYLFSRASYGNYPDVQGLWDKFRQEVSPTARKELIENIQKQIYERSIFLPVTSSTSPAAIGPRVKGNPYKVQPLIWFSVPLEDLELAD